MPQIDLDDATCQRIKKISELFQKAEAFLKRYQNLEDNVFYPSFNAMRYAGRSLSIAWTMLYEKDLSEDGNKLEFDRHIATAESACHAAVFDCADSIIGLIGAYYGHIQKHGAIEELLPVEFAAKIKKDAVELHDLFGRVQLSSKRVKEAHPELEWHANALDEERDRIAETREDRTHREDTYEEVSENLFQRFVPFYLEVRERIPLETDYDANSRAIMQLSDAWNAAREEDAVRQQQAKRFNLILAGLFGLFIPIVLLIFEINYTSTPRVVVEQAHPKNSETVNEAVEAGPNFDTEQRKSSVSSTGESLN